MKQDAILFIDIDDSPSVRYRYREPHFAAARLQGLLCLIAGVCGRTQLQRLQQDSDEVFLLETLSEQTILELVDELQDRYTVRAIFCHAGHASAQGQVGCIVARVCQKLGLVSASAEAIAACNNKYLMRRALQKHGLRSVPFALCNDEKELEEGAARVGYPLIAKPAFGGASAFIKRCSNWAQLRDHYVQFVARHGEAACADFYGCAHTLPNDDGTSREYIPGRSLMLEGFIEGVEGTVECVAAGNRIYPVLINEKLLLTERSGTVLENLLITPPVSFTAQQCDQIRSYAAACLQALGLTDALAHFEFRMTQQGPVVIEINPRLGGLYVNAALRDLAGFDPYQLYVSLLLRDPAVDTLLDTVQRKVGAATQSYAMLAVYPESSGCFKGFEGLGYLDDHPAVVEYAVQEAGGYLDADIEEHYLLKCWAKVDGVAHACALHDAVRQNLNAVIDLPFAG